MHAEKKDRQHGLLDNTGFVRGIGRDEEKGSQSSLS